MIKKAINILLKVEALLILAIIISFIYEANTVTENHQPQVEVFSDNLFVILSDVTFNSADVDDLTECDNIVIDMEILDDVDVDKVFAMLDNGASLYVRGEDLSLQEIGDILKLDFEPIKTICGAKIKQVEVYKNKLGYDYEINGNRVDIETARTRFRRKFL